jgi:hypothetical protein
MQLRRFLIALVILAALGWFALGRLRPAPAAIDAPVHSDAPSGSTAAEVLDRVEPAATRASAEPEAAPAARGSDASQARAESAPVTAALSGLIVRVLDPSSKPLPGAEVGFVTSGPFMRNVGGPLATDAGGCVRVRSGPEGVLDLRASDPEGRYGPAYAFERREAEGQVDMRLEATTPHTLQIVDEQGAAVETFAWRILDERQYRSHATGKTYSDEQGLLCDTRIQEGLIGAFAPTDEERSEHPEGRVELRTGSLAFAVQVDAENFAPAQAGPFSAAAAPAEIRVVLRRLPGIRGRVVFGGQGVPGAWVRLLGASESARTLLINGFPSRFGAFPVREVECTDDGSFLLPLRTSGEFTIQAGAENLCVAEFGPRRYAMLKGAEDLELVLPAPGAIEGRLLLTAGVKADEEIIGASRGDGRACSVHADAEGRFRFEGLTPGSWLLRPSNEDLDPNASDSLMELPGAPETSLPFTCEVRAGQTTRVDVDLRHPAVLLGEIRLAGWEGASSSGSLDPLGATYSQHTGLRADAAGSLRATVEQPGDYLLWVRIEVGERKRSLELQEVVHLVAGENTWKLDGPVGELALVNTLDEQTFVAVRCELPGGRTLSTGTNLRAHGEARLAGLPVGTWTSVHRQAAAGVEEVSAVVSAGTPARLEWK